MAEENPRIYQFGPFRLDASRQRLFRNGEPVTVTPKLFETLRVLVERGDVQISKDELMREVWGDTIVEESNLTSNVSNLRKLLGEKKSDHQYILTVPGEGYRFVAPVQVVVPEGVEVLVTERTRTSFTVEELTVPTWPVSQWKMLAGIAVATILLTTGGFLLFRYRNHPAPQIKSIAVLPFKPLLSSARDESLELGIADTLINRLSRQKYVRIRPTSAVRKYAGLEQDALAAGREQKVDAVLEGSIQRSDERIRVTVRLLNVANGEQLWADNFDEKFTDIFRVQDSISRQTAQAVVKLTGGEQELLTRRDTENSEAYILYVRGRYFWNKRSADGLNESINYFKQASEKDHNYALAYVGLADAYVVLPGYTGKLISETHPKARTYAEKALELNHQLPEPHVTLATIAADYWQWEEASRQFKQALELNPNYATAHQWYGEYLVHAGQLDEALQEFKLAQELDPTSPIISVDVGQALYFQRRYDEAIRQYQLTLELDRDFLPAHWLLGFAFLEKAMHGEAISSFERAVSLSGGASRYLALLAAAHARAGNQEITRRMLDKLNAMPEQRSTRAAELAMIYTALGDKQKAFEWLEKAYDDRSELMLFLRVDQFFDSLRGDPRFADLLRRVGPTN